MIEILMFRLADGAATNDFLSADRRVQIEFAYRQPGLVRRTTARGEDGEWIVIELWDGLEAADAARSAGAHDGAVAALMALVDPGSVVRRRYTELE